MTKEKRFIKEDSDRHYDRDSGRTISSAEKERIEWGESFMDEMKGQNKDWVDGEE